MKRYICIMAGGIGSRFWPSSTSNHPKQFLDILGVGKSLIRMTFERCLNLVPAEQILIVTNKRYKDLVLDHLPELPQRNVLCEPSMNNTGPCVAYSMLRIRSEAPDAVFAMLPSDHMILKEQEYLARLNEAFDFAADNEAIVTLGIKPTRPDTGYGYIEMAPEDQRAVAEVLAFREKPDLTTAEQYLASGNYLWNAGMFIWSVPTIQKSFETNAPEILHELLRDASKYGTAEEQNYIDQVYPLTPSISVDYAILEKANNVWTIPSDIGWSDLGTWNSLHSYLEKDENGNVLQTQQGKFQEVADSLVRVEGQKTVVIRGLSNFIVIDEEDALLIYPKDHEQDIKAVVKELS